AEVHPAARRRPERPVRPPTGVLDEQHRRARLVEHERADAHADAPAVDLRERLAVLRAGRHQSASTFAEARRTLRVEAGGRGTSSVPCAFACSTAAPTNATNSGCGRSTVVLYSG